LIVNKYYGIVEQLSTPQEEKVGQLVRIKVVRRSNDKVCGYLKKRCESGSWKVTTNPEEAGTWLAGDIAEGTANQYLKYIGAKYPNSPPSSFYLRMASLDN